jgi:PAS domain S-box-containing protein
VNLLMGIASQLATSIVSARSFEKLKESEKKYRELVETASSLILRVDGEGRISFVNTFAQRLLDASEAELLNTEATRFLLPPDHPDYRRLGALIASMSVDPLRPEVRETEIPLRSGGSAWIAWTFRPIRDDSGRFREMLCIGNDITMLKRAEQERSELQTRLQRAQKMEAIGTLAGGVAHDLNNILSGIVSYPELLLMDLSADSPLRKPVETIKKSGERAAAIVQDLLTLARRGVESVEVVNLNQTVRDYLASPEFAKLLHHHPDVTVETRLGPDTRNILGSPVHLSKALMNLVTNAAEAMPEGGTIVLGTGHRHIEEHRPGGDGPPAGDYVTLTVTDTGIGIPAEEIERVFEPFYTKKTMGRSGTGLGMAVVWGTVKDHRGHIEIDSACGRGTEITLSFPATRRQVRGEAERPGLEAIAGRGETILVVDDIGEQREIAIEILGKLGYRAVAVASGEEAVAHLGRHAVDLVVLDMIMEPGIDGLETFRRILALRPGQKTVIASGYSESSRVRDAQRLGAGTYIKKPYLLRTFGQAVRAELDKPLAPAPVSPAV